MGGLEGRRVLITGAGRGIGAHLALRLGEAGCKLALSSRTSAELTEVAARAAARPGAVALPLVCDLAEENAAERMVEQAIVGLGGIDVLVNNAAAPGPFAYLEQSDMAEWTRALQVNLMGTVRCCRAVLPHMKRQRRGKIVNFSGASVGWGNFTPLQSAYVTSKFAIYGFTEALAREVAEFNIQVNAVSPGAVATRLRTSLLTPEEQRSDTKTAAELSPEPTARLVAFLASDRSGPMTGKLLSSHWDDVETLAREAHTANASPLNTVRKIDGRNYFFR
jgi:3-oxoacyl-[acyl-carrier protein] reductase